MEDYNRLLNSLKPIDVIVAKKRVGLGRILNHYIVYLGNGIFVGNLKGCVKQVTQNELYELLKVYEPIEIREFTGTQLDAREAIFRVKQKLGHPYSFLGFNCEHFANWVQYGKETSNQVTNGFLILAGLVTLKLITTGDGKR
ncbi:MULTISPECIES: lecithin retinol acyltransferase family protein [Tenacibaculum]|uniref:LRAT domain-containing protein n=1 Tax=Tenacibaculum todarodis TaxID=1850252 RepID=A0A1L3JLA0_9FLAO|nr:MULTISPECIES: lecithin retinol acyltransferase family protein [Tenacibaculum]APG65908.1 hypothetical protein LPB136_11270 [Tenacibaculum todarodis]MCH3883698.1 lecithin retinol acyltransferase family protein [Tenacibaculum aquimarinum]